jgi:hypothetical protein
MPSETSDRQPSGHSRCRRPVSGQPCGTHAPGASFRIHASGQVRVTGDHPESGRHRTEPRSSSTRLHGSRHSSKRGAATRMGHAGGGSVVDASADPSNRMVESDATSRSAESSPQAVNETTVSSALQPGNGFRGNGRAEGARASAGRNTSTWTPPSRSRCSPRSTSSARVHSNVGSPRPNHGNRCGGPTMTNSS